MILAVTQDQQNPLGQLRSGAEPNDDQRQRTANAKGSGDHQRKCRKQIVFSSQFTTRHDVTPLSPRRAAPSPKDERSKNWLFGQAVMASDAPSESLAEGCRPMVKEILTTESRQLPATLGLAKRILFLRNAYSRCRGARPIAMFDSQALGDQDSTIKTRARSNQLSSVTAADAGVLLVRPRTCQARATCTHWSRSAPLVAAALLMAVSASF
jgi:hypothetical protein